jgi:ferric enterobactin receptor
MPCLKFADQLFFSKQPAYIPSYLVTNPGPISEILQNVQLALQLYNTMARQICILFYILGAVLAVSAQQQQEKTLLWFSGQVIDSSSRIPLNKATVVAQGPLPAAIKTNAITDSSGKFDFPRLSPGTYAITVSFTGYQVLQARFKTGITQHEAIYALLPSIKALENVTVTGNRSLIENKADRIVYNVEKDITSQSGVATDVLRKIPQVTVDINGNVELLGNPGVRFLINGKPSAVFGNSIADALQSIPAAQVQSIEVISSPGAAYDASGTGGIINIILRKNRVKGFSGIVNMTAGTRMENGALNLNFKNNNIGIAGYFSGTEQLKALTLSATERNSIDTANHSQYYLHQQGNSEFKRFGYRSGISLEWDISPKNNLSVSTAWYNLGNTNDGAFSQHIMRYDRSGNLILSDDNRRQANTRFNNAVFEAAADYRRKFKKEKETFSVSINYSAGLNNSAYFQTQRPLITDSLSGGSNSKNPGKDYLTTIALDYALPVSKNLLVQMGLRSDFEQLFSNSQVYTLQPAHQQFNYDSMQSSHSTFRRQIFAAYTAAIFSFLKTVNVIAGLRFEHTLNDASYSKNPGLKIPDYNNLAPSLTLSHIFKKQQSIRASYAYRLERPDYRDLNPFVNLADPHNIVTGNPYIVPEIGKEWQLGFNQPFGAESNLSITLVYTFNSPDIKTYTVFYPQFTVGDSIYTDVNVSKRDNIAAEKKWGANIAFSTVFWEKLNLRTNIQLYNRTTKNIYATPAVISGFEYRTNMNINYQWSNGVVAEAFGNYNSGLRWQGRRAAFSSYTIAVRKQILNSKGSIGLIAVNAFGKYLTQRSTQLGTGFTGNSLLQIPYRSFGISLLYKFGKMKITKVKEEENFLAKPPVTEN